jgi:REP element-mobilizing transposase RayT
MDKPEVAEMLRDSFSWLETKGWTLYAVVVLSTHVHILMRNQVGVSAQLVNHLSLFKNYTSRMANKILGRKGRFWSQTEFDH